MLENTATVIPIIHTYKEINVGKYRTVKHYELQKVENGEPQLEKIVQLAENRDFANSKPEFWFTHRKNNKWVKPFLTGLFRTNAPDVFKGDINRKRNLVLFGVDNLSNTLIVNYFKGYFTYKTDTLIDSF